MDGLWIDAQLQNPFLFRDVDNMLSQQPPNCFGSRLDLWRKLGPLSCEEISSKAPDYAPIILDGEQQEKRSFNNEHGNACYGTVDRATGKCDGIVRTIVKSLSVNEGQYRAGKKHGYMRTIFDDHYMITFYKEGLQHGLVTKYAPDGLIRSQQLW